MSLKKTFISLITCILLTSCQGNNSDQQVDGEDTEFKREIEQGLVLINSTIEQSSTQGEVLWRISADKAVYAEDNQTANLENITGNLFEKGEIILKIVAEKGKVTKDGQRIYLQGGIIALDPRNNAELKGEEVIWKPEEHILIMTGKDRVNANHEDLVISSNQVKYNTENQILELEGNIIGTTRKPTLQITTEHLFWRINENKIIGNKLLNITRYDEQNIITDKMKTDQAEIDLKNNIATLNGNIEYQSLQPALQAATQRITWYYDSRWIEAINTTKLVQPEENLTLTANIVKFNLDKNEVYLQEGVYGESNNKESEIYGDMIIWNTETKNIYGEGNIYYKQQNPELNLRGAKAYGNLGAKNITVQGDSTQRVVTNIFPKDN